MGWAMFELVRASFLNQAGVRTFALAVESIKTGKIRNLVISSREVGFAKIHDILSAGEITALEAEEIISKITDLPICQTFGDVVDKLVRAGTGEFVTKSCFRLHGCNEHQEVPHGNICKAFDDGTIERMPHVYFSLKQLVNDFRKTTADLPDLPIEDLRTLWRLVAEAKECGLGLEEPEEFARIREELGDFGLDIILRAFR